MTTVKTSAEVSEGYKTIRMGPAEIAVHVIDMPSGDGMGIWLQIGDSIFLFPLDGASRLADALTDQVQVAHELADVESELGK